MMLKNNSKKTILILGANGFIGSHIVDALAEAGHKVVACDRFSTTPNFIERKNIKVIKADINQETALEAAMDGVDILFHCFSATTPFSADSDPYTDISNNLLTNIRIFENAVAKKIKRIIYISSGGAVYGSASENKEVREDDMPQPISPYGISKLATEHYLSYYKRKYGIEYMVYRLTNPYGPRQGTKNNQGVIPIFVKKILNNEPITIYGDGTMTRDYIFIVDAIKMIVTSFDQTILHNTYNIGSGEQVSLNEIIKVLEKIFGREIKIRREEAPKTFLQKTPVSIGLYENDFGEFHNTALVEGLEHTINDMRKNHNIVKNS